MSERFRLLHSPKELSLSFINNASVGMVWDQWRCFGGGGTSWQERIRGRCSLAQGMDGVEWPSDFLLGGQWGDEQRWASDCQQHEDGTQEAV